MANETSNPQLKPQPQMISLAKIHDLPGVFIAKQPDKSYGGLVTSISVNGVKEAVILRLREDGEYQLVTGYRRRRASELAKKQDIPAYIYEMTLQEAIAYHRQVKMQPNAPIPGKLVELSTKAEKSAEPAKPEASKKDEKATEPAAPSKDSKAEAAPKTEGKEEKPTTSTEKPKETDKATEPAKPETPAKDEKAAEPAVPGKDGKAEATPKTEDKEKNPATPAEKPKEANKAVESAKPETPMKGEKAAEPAVPDKGRKNEVAPKTEGKEEKPAVPAEKPKETGKTAEPAKAETRQNKPVATAMTGPAAVGPAGTAITQIFKERLDPPDAKALKELPVPKEGESFFITLHPGYLEKSKYNTFSVDTASDNFKELRKSVELVGIKDPVLTRINPEGGLEILSGQRRHLAAAELNYPVPAIIQKIDDADAKIIVADGNLHRDKISTYDLSRALRMKMEGMKQKSGRRKKGEIKAEELDSDEKLAKEMGMSVSKLNRIIRLSEAAKDVCDRVDDGSLALSIASAISFLKPANQDEVLHLMDLNYKVTNDRVERMKKVEKTGKLDEHMMREILEDKDIQKKVVPPTPVPAPTPTPTPATAAPTASPSAPTSTPSMAPTTIPASPDVKPAAPTVNEPVPTTPVTSAVSTTPTPPTGTAPEKEADVFKGAQERPENTKVILTGDRLRRYFPDVSMTPREIEESVYEALEERRQRQMKMQQKTEIFKKSGPTR